MVLELIMIPGSLKLTFLLRKVRLTMKIQNPDLPQDLVPPLRDDHEEPGEEPVDAESDESPQKRLSPEEDIDVDAPETVSLLFATALPDNKGSTVLEAIQDVVSYCWALNYPDREVPL